MNAAARGHADCARLLIDGGADKELRTRQGSTALICAVESGQTNCVRLLIDAGADKDTKDWVRVGNCFAVPLLPFLFYVLLRIFLFIRCRRCHVLYSYCTPAYFDGIVSGGCESDSQGGMTALMCATANGRADCARLLIDAGADKEVKDDVRVGRSCFISPFVLLLFCCIDLIVFSFC